MWGESHKQRWGYSFSSIFAFASQGGSVTSVSRVYNETQTLVLPASLRECGKLHWSDVPEGSLSSTKDFAN